MKKLRVAVLMGGPSAEHDVSLKSGAMVAENFDPKKYAVQKVVIERNGRWPISLSFLKKRCDAAFIVMHGEYGEDGTIQEILEKAKIKFTGSGSKASRLGMDKLASSAIFKKSGLRVPGDAQSLPLVVKPADRGSSVGVSIVKSVRELPEAVTLALKYSNSLLLQEFIHGRELTCGVVEVGNEVRALPPTEIISKASEFFDFKAKYVAGASREITPAELSPQKTKEVQNAALLAHKAIGAKGLSRTDMIMDNAGRIYVLEINTIPGMTKTSLLPQQAKAAGISFPKLLDLIVESAVK